nr:retrovirus-related Pol polyprotein from transposon TNT 1-94 [Tanacetum cinerariifolium]
LQQFNLFSISQICNKKNKVLFTDTECLVLSKDFKLTDDSMVVLRVPRSKGIKRKYSNARTSQQNRVTEMKNRTLIEAVRAMLADSKLPTMFWTEAVRTACYVLNRVLVTSPHNKTPYALLTGNVPFVSHFKPFGCHVTILNTSDHLGKFDGKADEGCIVGYSVSNKAYRVYNVSNKRVEETMNMRYLEEKPNVHGTQDADSDSDCDEQVIIIPSYPSHNIQGTEPKDTSGDEVDDSPLNFADEIFQKELARLKGQEQRATSDAESLGLGFKNNTEELQKRASAKTVPPGSIPVPTCSIQVPSGDTMVSTDDVPVHTSSPTDSFFDDKPITRFLRPELHYLVQLENENKQTDNVESLLMIQEGGLVIFKCSTWTRWPNFVDKEFILVVQVFNLVLPEFLLSLELGPPAIQATIDKTPYTIIEDLVRSQLQLADDGGIDDLPTMEIYSGMDNLGSTQAPLAGQTSGGAEDLITLTALSSVVSTLVHKVNSLEIELKDYKKLFKDVVGKLVKKVKAIEVRLGTTKRKMVVSDSDREEGGKQDVDLDALLALANAAVTVDSNNSPGGASDNPGASTSVPADVPTGANVPTGSTSVPTDVPTSVAPAGVSNKGKALMVEEDITVKERTFKQMQEDILGEQAAKRLHDEEQAQVEADASLSKTLLGDDVSEDNFPARMAALIKRKKQALAKKLAQERKDRPMTQGQQRTYMRQFVKNQSCAVYSTRWSMARVKSFTDDQLKEEFENIQKAIPNIQIQAFCRTLKRIGPVLEEPSSKRQKSTEAPIISVLEVPQLPVVSSPKSSGTRRKSLGRNRLTKPKSKLQELDLDVDDKIFIKVVSDEDSKDKAPRPWSALVGWEVIATPLGDINALYRIDRSTKHFTTLRQILHMVDRRDLVKLYGLVVKYYENHHVAGARLILEVVFMFVDVSYPLSVKLMERMLTHKLDIDKDVVGNDMTTAEQLIRFIKNQLVAAQFAQNYRVFNSPMLHLLRVEMVINSPWIMPIMGTKELASTEQTASDAPFSKDISLICADFSSILVKTQSSWYVVPTGRVVVPTGRYVVPAGNVIVVSTGRLSLIPTGRVLIPGHKSNECPNPKEIEAKPLKSIKEEKVEKTGIPTLTARAYMMATEGDKVVRDVVTEVEIAGDEIVVVSKVYRDVEIEIDDSVFKIDLIPIVLGAFDIVIGMDWLDRKYTSRGCQAYMAHVVDTNVKKKSTKDVPVVNEFFNFYFEDLSVVPPERQVEF